MNSPASEVRVDVTQVKEQEIPQGQFPVPYPQSDFRVYICPNAHEHILKHASTNTSIELCGMLIGEVLKDNFGPFVVVSEMIEGEHADGSSAGVTFTQETWAHIYRELDSRNEEKRIVGWYHTHPGFGIFLSSMDQFIHRNFFNLPWHVAYVIDPLAGTEGIFEWRNDQTVPSAPYWVGEIPMVGPQASVSDKALAAQRERQPVSTEGQDEQNDGPGGQSDSARERPRADTVLHMIQVALLLVLLFMALFKERTVEMLERAVPLIEKVSEFFETIVPL